MSSRAQEAITKAFPAPNHNFGKDEYADDITGHEARYWQGTESGLLGAFEFKGASSGTAGDGSCDTGSRSMGAGFCNFNLPRLAHPNTKSPPLHQEQRTQHTSRVGREDEGVSSNRPELVTLTEFWIVMRTISAFYTSQIEKQPSKSFTNGLATLNSIFPNRRPQKNILKLQKRVQPGVATLLVKVKVHRGDPLNEEADIRAKMGRHKEQKEVIWDSPTNRTDRR